MNLELKKGWLVDPISVTLTEVFYKEVTLNKNSYTKKHILVFKDEEMLSYSDMAKIFDNYEEALTFFKEVKEETVKGYERKIKIYEDYSKAQITQLGMWYKGEIEYYRKFIETHKADLV